MQDQQKQIAALQEERRGYVVRNLQDRVKAVDEQLRALGVSSRETATAVPTEERATVETPKKRITSKKA
jgi:hypothetical protein